MRPFNPGKILPGSMPSRDPAFSKMDVYSLTFSGLNGGTLMGPLACGCKVAGGACGGGTLAAVVIPSNFGKGPAGLFMRISACASHPRWY